MKNLTQFQEKQAKQLSYLNNAVNHYRKDYPEWENATVEVSQDRKKTKKCFVLSIPKTNGKQYISSICYTYEEMNAFFNGYTTKFENNLISLEKNKQSLIDEFYKFLESKEVGLSEKYNSLFNSDLFDTLDEFLKNQSPNSFIIGAFVFAHTDDCDFWYSLNTEWVYYLPTI